MFHQNSQLAIPEGTAPPRNLPAEFYSRVEVFDIIDSEFPGYVYLERSYLLTECSDDGNYNAMQCPRQYLVLDRTSNTPSYAKLHGPATVTELTRLESGFISHITGLQTSGDEVFCIRCLSWPSQAADWPTRHRSSGWPDSATVERVVSNGCDVVGVAHRLFRQDERITWSQWRLSFSRAEIVLLNNWMPEQQIVYHMIRCFTKIRQLNDIRDNTGAKIISNYNIKTLMLWACELQPRSWWTEDLNFVRICVKLLLTLERWVTGARYKHYFVNNCNMLDHVNNSNYTLIQTIAMNLSQVTETWLAEWFFTYINVRSSVLIMFDGCLKSSARVATYKTYNTWL